MKLSRFWVLFVSVVLLAGLIRFNKLGAIPHGMTWDEAAIGYNGSAIWKTRRDEWLVRLPVSFRSFGDYKAPAAIYINAPFTYVFGMNVWAVRLPFALAGVLAVAGFMLLIKELFESHGYKPTAENIAILGGLMMTLSPWHIHFSRAGFESGMALMLLVWGMWCWLASFRINSKMRQWAYVIAAAVLFALTVYTYHSAKIVTPLLVLVFALFNLKRVHTSILPHLGAAVVGIMLLIPFYKDVVYGQGLQRLDTSILNDTSGVELVKAISVNMIRHISPTFMVMGETTTYRHGTGVWGVLLPTTFALCVFALCLGLFQVVMHRRIYGRDLKLFFISLLWMIVGLLPAAIGEEIPHSNRALLALPGLLLLALIGGKYLVSIIAHSAFNKRVEGSHREKDQVVKAVFGCVLLLHGMFALGFLQYYFSEFAKKSASDFKDGYLEAFAIAKEYEDQVDKILFTNDYGQPYIYALFVRKTNPIWYQGGSLIKYEFTDSITNGDLERAKTLVVASSSDETPEALADTLIYGSDGEVRFKIYLPNQP